MKERLSEMTKIPYYVQRKAADSGSIKDELERLDEHCKRQTGRKTLAMKALALISEDQEFGGCPEKSCGSEQVI